MIFLSIILVLGMTTWVLVSASRPLLAASLGWRVAFIVLTVAGLALGWRLITWSYYQSPTMKLTGYPFIIGGAELIRSEWRGGLVSRYLYFAFFADIGLGLLVFLIPFRLVQWLAFRHRRAQ